MSFYSLEFSLTPSISQGTRGRSRVDVALLALSEQGGGGGGVSPEEGPGLLLQGGRHRGADPTQVEEHQAALHHVWTRKRLRRPKRERKRTD